MLSDKRQFSPELSLSELTRFDNQGILLRDFFNATDADTLKATILSLCALSDNSNTAFQQYSGNDWREVEYNFNELFVGPGKLLAAPYASVYLEKNALVMGQSTLDLRAFMQKLGLHINQTGNSPDDHISYALELAVLLSINAHKSAEFGNALTRYCHEYLILWLPVFIERVESQAKTDAIKAIIFFLTEWFGELKMGVNHE